MFRMIIESDPQKVKQSGMAIDEFNNLLRAMCLESYFRESSPNHYILDAKHDEVGSMLVLSVRFDIAGFIIPNLSKWITYSDEEGEVDQLS